MIIANDLRRGVVIRLDGDFYVVLDFQHVKPGKGGAFVKAKLRNIKKDIIIDKTFRAGEKVEDIFIEKKKMQYLYSDDDSAVFMDLETYDQITVPKTLIEQSIKFLKEGEEVDVSVFENEIIAVEPPTFVELRVDYTEPGVKGDTATTAFKPAVLETGATVQVPLFINQGDVIKIDTRTGNYIERVSS